MMMVKEATRKEEAPLHDMTCIGIDTCSARSISCRKEDFLDLEIVVDKNDHLRGIGGNNGVAGKGCLVFYVKDSEGKMKAILEPKGFYLENPPAQFRIIGQQRMKHKGLCATQDHDDAGTDILKCKRSGTILPLTEGRGLLLLRTFSYTPSAELQEQLRSYVRKLRQDNSFLPHVVDLEEMALGSDTVLIMNEGIPSTYITNRFATLGSNAVKNISFGDNIAIFYFIFYYTYLILKKSSLLLKGRILYYALNVAPVGVILKSK
jgi:hypothetical protein